MTIPGKQADFLVGGQIPIPYAAGPQQIAIQYKEFGVKLVVTPTILRDGGVETVIAPEVSDLDFQDGVVAQRFRGACAQNEQVVDGRRDALGRIDRDGRAAAPPRAALRRQDPGLGDLPILGKLFRSTRYQSSQTDVVFVMTPQILTR